MNPIVLPSDLTALYTLLANPFTAGIVLSILLEKMPFIEDGTVENWIKALACVFVGIVWSLFVTVAGPNGLPTTPNGWYSVIVTGLAVVFSMNVWHSGVIKGLPGLREFLLALFNPATTTVASTVSTTSGNGTGTSFTVGKSESTSIPNPPTAPPSEIRFPDDAPRDGDVQFPRLDQNAKG